MSRRTSRANDAKSLCMSVQYAAYPESAPSCSVTDNVLIRGGLAGTHGYGHETLQRRRSAGEPGRYKVGRAGANSALD
jgi:hypothetical protein